MLAIVERLFNMSKFRLFLALWTCVSAAVLIFFGNQAFKPELAPPSLLISNLNVTRLNAEDRLKLRLQWPNILRDLREVESLMLVISSTQKFQPVDLKISSARPLDLRLEGQFAQLGISQALAPGQIAHVILESWFLQNNPIRNSADRLQIILHADILWAAAHSRFELGIPNTQLRLSLSDSELENSHPEEILFYIASTKSFSESEWSPTSFAVRPDLNFDPLSLRKYFLNQILKAERKMGLQERIDFLKLVARDSIAAQTDKINFENLSEYVNQTFATYRLNLHLEKYSVDSLFENSEILKTASPYSISYITRERGQWMLFPGKVVLNSVDQISIRNLVVAVDKIADIKKLESSGITAKKVLAIENPSHEMINYDALKTFDFDRFAKRNKKIRFAVFDQESLKYAASKNLDGSLSQLLDSPPPKMQSLKLAAETLGITHAHWDSITQTYRANGAIEALQIWR